MPTPNGAPRVVRGLGVITRMLRHRHAHPIQQRGFLQHARQIAGQQDRRPAGITKSPHPATQIVDAVAAFDAERETHFLPKPVLVQCQRRTVVRFNGYGSAVRATAHPSTPAVTPELLAKLFLEKPPKI
jgi:hypothetical protein